MEKCCGLFGSRAFALRITWWRFKLFLLPGYSGFDSGDNTSQPFLLRFTPSLNCGSDGCIGRVVRMSGGSGTCIKRSSRSWNRGTGRR